MGLLKLLLVVFLGILIVAAGIGFYFYNFYTYKTVRVCVSTNATETNMFYPCSSDQECINAVLRKVGSEQRNVSNIMQKAPDFLKNLFSNVTSEINYCNSTCRTRDAYGLGLGGIKEVAYCKEGYKEFKVEITGKRGVQLLRSGVLA